MSVIGSKLPEPWFSRVISGKTGIRRFRLCRTCAHVTVTIEIPLSERQKDESRADCCYVHTRTKGILLWHVTPQKALTHQILSRGVLAALAMGGVWRRRACPLNYKFRPIGQTKHYLHDSPSQYKCVDKDGKPTRWTTVEVSSEGVVVQDITKCPNCGGQTRLYSTLTGKLREFREKFYEK